MALTAIDWSQSLATWLAADGAPFNTDIEDDTLDPDPPEFANLVRSWIQETYEHHRGSACSVLGRAANSAGEVAHIAAAANDRVLARSSNAVAFQQVATDMVSDAAITAAKLASGSVTLAKQDVTIADIDLSADSNNTLANGAETIGGLAAVAANAAAANVFEVLNGSGLHFDANATNSAFSTSAQTASYVTFTLASLLGGTIDPAGVYEISIRFGSLTIGTNNNKVNMGITNPASFTDTGHVSLLRSGGVIVSRFEGAGASAVSGPSPGAADCLHLIVEGNLIRGFFSTWSGGFAARTAWSLVGQNSFATGANADADSGLAPTNRLVIAFATGETGAAMDVVISRLRVRQIG